MGLNFNKTVAFIKFLTGKRQDEIAKSIGYTGPHFSVLLGKGDNEDVQKLLWDKYRTEINDFFGTEQNLLEEPEVEYGNKVKLVDAEQLLVHDSLLIKGMLRVLLRYQAELLAVQKKVSVKKVLEQMTKAVRDETQAEFDEL